MFSKHCSVSSSSSPSRSPFYEKNGLVDVSSDAQSNGWEFKIVGKDVPCSIYRPQLPNANMACVAIKCPFELGETVKLRVHAQDDIKDDIVYFIHHAKGVITEDCIPDVFSFTTTDLFPDSATHVNVINSVPFTTEDGASSYDPRCIGLGEFKSTKEQELYDYDRNEIKLVKGWNYCFVRLGVQKPDVESVEFEDTTFETYKKKGTENMEPLTVNLPTLQRRTYCFSLSLEDKEGKENYGVKSPYRNCIFKSKDGIVGDYPSGIMKGFKEVSRDNKVVFVEKKDVRVVGSGERHAQFRLYKLYLLLNANTEKIWGKKWPNLISGESGISQKTLRIPSCYKLNHGMDTPWFEFCKVLARSSNQRNSNRYWKYTRDNCGMKFKHYTQNRNNARYPFVIEINDDNQLILKKITKGNNLWGMKDFFYYCNNCYNLWNIFEIKRKNFVKVPIRKRIKANTKNNGHEDSRKRIRVGSSQKKANKKIKTAPKAFAKLREVYQEPTYSITGATVEYFDTVPLFTPTGSPVNNSIENLEPLSPSPKELMSKQVEMLWMNEPLTNKDDFSDVDEDELAANVQAQNDHMKNHLAVREDMDDIREMALMKKNGFDWEATNNTEPYPVSVEELDSFDFGFMFD